jgi:cytochrome oxidase Cu insertion factor (SCO1/SenC/PrrC family)
VSRRSIKSPEIARAAFVAVLLFLCPLTAAFAEPIPHLPLESVDQKTVFSDQWANSPQIVAFFYTSCRIACPLTLRALRKVVEQGKKEGVTPEVLLISLDPERDSLTRLARYSAELPGEHWHVLSASPANLEKLTRHFGFHYIDEDGHILHDRKFFLVRPSGETVEISGWDHLPTRLF